MTDDEINRRTRKTCSIEGCRSVSDARGMCKTHYNRHRRHGNPLLCKPKGGVTHGRSNTPENKIWRAIKNRCHNPSASSYSRYGARGIAVCERWVNSFENFLADMGARPSTDHSIERVDNNLGYSPENCVWATRVAQANNTRTNHYIEASGERLTIQEWSRRTGIPHQTILARVARLGWPEERAISQPSRTKRRVSNDR